MSFEDKRFCVYLHRRPDNNEVFYVGQGTEARAYSRKRKMKAWNDLLEQIGDFIVEIVEKDLDKKEALRLEIEYIEKYRETCLNNPHSSSIVNEMDFDYFNAKFYVDETSPTGLRHKTAVYAGPKLSSCMAKVGDVAGNLSLSDGYYSIMVDRKVYRVHRIIYLLAYGSIDSLKVIDHTNGIKTDNRISNLRLVTQFENMRNKRIMSNNITGVSGVCYHKSSNSYRASIKLQYKRLSKNFSINKYGEEQALRLATEWRKQQEEIHNFNLSKPKE